MGVHQLGQGPSQGLAKGSGGVVLGKIVGLETAARHQGHRQGISEGELQGGAGGGRQIKRTRFFFYRHVEHHVGRLAEGRVWTRGHRHNAATSVGQGGKQLNHLFASAAFRQTQNDVLGVHGADIAMQGFSCMQEQRPGSGGVEGGRNFGRDVRTLAHPRHNHISFCFDKNIKGFFERIIQRGSSALERL